MMTPQQKGLAWTAAMALFMQSLDATILNTALPVMSASLHESPLQMELAIISYALTVAALIPLSGWLADRLGTLNVFRLAVGGFVFGAGAWGAETAVKHDEDQGHGAHGLRERKVIKGNTRKAVTSEGHSEQYKDKEGRNAEAERDFIEEDTGKNNQCNQQ